MIWSGVRFMSTAPSLLPGSESACDLASNRQSTEPIRPVNQAVARQADGAAQFGKRGKQQVSANRHMRLVAKTENQQRRHHRAAAHTCQAHHKSHGETGKQISI